MAQASSSEGLVGCCGGFKHTAYISLVLFIIAHICGYIPVINFLGYLQTVAYIYLMVVLTKTRAATRKRLGIEEEEFKCADCVCSVFCSPCTSAQLNRITIEGGIDKQPGCMDCFKPLGAAAAAAAAAPAAEPKPDAI